LISHALTHTTPSNQAALTAAISRAPSLATDEDNRTIRQLVRESGSIQYAVDLMQREQSLVEERTRQMEHPEIVRLVSGVSDVFLTPLLSRLEGLQSS
jgi:geranylgeranyl pyrophosphate synthase